MEHTAPDAEIIGIIDADYVVHPNWLSDLVPLFADPKVGLVQAPQDHRDGRRSPLHHIMNGEYAGFFDIGMVERNRDQRHHRARHHVPHPPRRDGSGRRLVERHDLRRHRSRPVNSRERLARALHQPIATATVCCPIRSRPTRSSATGWAYGGMQIAKKHWRRMLPGATRLTSDQRKEFSTGWLNWLGAESIGVVVAILNLIWVPIVAFVGIAIPDKILTLPILAAFAGVAAALHCALSRPRRNPAEPGAGGDVCRRCRCSGRWRARSAWA